MSVVWRAQDEVLRRSVAVKVLSPQHLSDASSRQRISAEARAAAGLSHPHVASVYDYGEALGATDQPVPYVVMELLTGRSLAQLLHDGPLKPRQAMHICAEVAAALAAAHEKGIVHRDVKPANVMITPNGAKVVDFGIAAAAGDYADLDTDSIMFGTPAYLAPERLDDGPVVPGTDVYAVGLLLYRTLTGALPWSVETTTQILRAHVYIDPQPLPRIAGLPTTVHALYNRCLAKDPKARPSAAEVARVLAQAAGISTPPLGSAQSVKADDTGAGVAHAGSGTSPDAQPGAAAVDSRRRYLVPLALLLIAMVAAVALSPRLSGRGDRNAAADPGIHSGQSGRPSPLPADPTGTASAGAGSVGGSSVPALNGTGAAGGTGERPDIPPLAMQPVGTGTGGTDPATTDPGGTVGSPSGNPTMTAAGSVVRTFTSDGGSIVTRCTGTKVAITAIQAARGYVAARWVKGAHDETAARFRPVSTDSDITNYTIRVRCVDGTPDGKIIRNDPTPDASAGT
jgi:tRNA A-37 threonylcarbamoyl transferase component Bud32